MFRATTKKTDDQSPDTSTSSKTSRKIDSIEMLPNELLVKIFRYIPISQWASMERVSPRFRDITYELWETLEKLQIFDDLFASTKYFGEKRIDEERSNLLLDKLSMRATKLCDVGGLLKLNVSSMHLIDLNNLRRVDFSGLVNMGADDLSTFLEQYESRDRLRTLIIPDSILSELSTAPASTRLMESFSNVDGIKPPLQLEELRIEKVSTNGTHFSDYLQTIDATRLTSFWALGIPSCQFDLRPFLDRATNLRQLVFKLHCECQPGTSAAMRNENVSVLEAIGKLEHLEDLRIGWSAAKNVQCECRIVSGAVEDLFRSLGGRRKPDGTRAFGKLLLSGLFAMPEFVEPIATYLPDLECLALEIDRLDGHTLSIALASQSKLKMLRLQTKYNGNSNNANTLDRYVKIEDILRNKSTLESLCFIFPNTGRIRGDLKQLAQCERLRNVRFVMWNRDRLGTDLAMDDSALLTCADGFGPNLTLLTLGGPLFTTDEGLGQFLSKATRLEEVVLTRLSIPDDVLYDLPNSCPKLMGLQMFNCENTTKAGVQAVLDGCPRIKVLRFNCKEDMSWYPSELELEKYRRVVFK